MNLLPKLTLFLALAFCSVPSVRSADSDAASVQIDIADVPGNWMALHPEWRGNIVFYADGTFVRPHIGGGLWRITIVDGKSSMSLRWNSWGSENLAAISPEHFSGPQRRGEFRLYRVPPAPPKTLSEASAPADLEVTKGRMNQSKWELIDHKRFVLNSDGSVSCEFDDRKGTWTVLAPYTLKITVPWLPAPADIVTTNHDGTILRWTDDETNLAVREGA